MKRILMKLVAAAMTVGVVLGLTGAPAQAAGPQLANQLVRKMSINDINRHLIAFQRFADRNGGLRTAYSGGYQASLDYVAGKLRGAGFNVSTHEFTYIRAVVDASSISTGSERMVPYEFLHSLNTPVGGLTGPLLVVPVDANTGCQPEDYAGLSVAGTIALIRRGGCPFVQKQVVAANLGAIAAIMYNNVEGPGVGSLVSPANARIPTAGITKIEGARLVEHNGSVATIEVRQHDEQGTSHNLITQTRTGRQNNVVVAGAQLDAENTGAGINDNGSGAAALLEIALKLGPTPKVNNGMRFIFWGSEIETQGSKAYLRSLTFEQQLDIALYLNMSMIGSTNGGYFVYDGDNSDGIGGGPFGSSQIERALVEYLNGQGFPTEGTDVERDSDHLSFLSVGIPGGALYTGGFKYKTDAQVAKWGGTAGVGFDPCHQLSCDDLGHVDRTRVLHNARAMASVAVTYAISTEDVNGVPARAQRASIRKALVGKAQVSQQAS